MLSKDRFLLRLQKIAVVAGMPTSTELSKKINVPNISLNSSLQQGNPLKREGLTREGPGSPSVVPKATNIRQRDTSLNKKGFEQMDRQQALQFLQKTSAYEDAGGKLRFSGGDIGARFSPVQQGGVDHSRDKYRGTVSRVDTTGAPPADTAANTPPTVAGTGTNTANQPKPRQGQDTTAAVDLKANQRKPTDDFQKPKEMIASAISDKQQALQFLQKTAIGGDWSPSTVKAKNKPRLLGNPGAGVNSNVDSNRVSPTSLENDAQGTSPNPPQNQAQKIASINPDKLFKLAYLFKAVDNLDKFADARSETSLGTDEGDENTGFRFGPIGEENDNEGGNESLFSKDMKKSDKSRKEKQREILSRQFGIPASKALEMIPGK